MTHILGRKPDRICRCCGCSDDNACVTSTGPCFWVLLDVETPTGVCSACAAELDFNQEAMATACLPEVLDLLRRGGMAA